MQQTNCGQWTASRDHTDLTCFSKLSQSLTRFAPMAMPPRLFAGCLLVTSVSRKSSVGSWVINLPSAPLLRILDWTKFKTVSLFRVLHLYPVSVFGHLIFLIISRIIISPKYAWVSIFFDTFGQMLCKFKSFLTCTGYSSLKLTKKLTDLSITWFLWAKNTMQWSHHLNLKTKNFGKLDYKDSLQPMSAHKSSCGTWEADTRALFSIYSLA